MNPFSTAPLFVSLTANFEPRKRKAQAIKACIYAFAILAVFLLAGAMVRFMGREGIGAMTRLFGFLLICIGVQFLLTGIADFYGLRAHADH